MADEDLKQQSAPWEWAAGIAGLLLASAMAAYVFYEAVAGDKTPPQVKVEAVSILPQDRGCLVLVRAENAGGETAADVIVEGRVLADDGAVLERSIAYLRFVPAKASRQSGLFFSSDLRRHALELRALGYAQP